MMSSSNDQATRIANERQTMANIAWAKAQAEGSDSPKGLTTLGKSFWHKAKKHRNK